ncbi:unnamed protein product [Paramecium octaurelia]|uniref:Transmembrane protein n=1 Tax=Paramecium octaurelia TaxID=43137 RepID=A0A8S1WWU3_PAROT|nr:unnamed protein product [Paramecium octaurelia]
MIKKTCQFINIEQKWLSKQLLENHLYLFLNQQQSLIRSRKVHGYNFRKQKIFILFKPCCSINQLKNQFVVVRQIQQIRKLWYQLQQNGWLKKLKCVQVMGIDESIKSGEIVLFTNIGKWAFLSVCSFILFITKHLFALFIQTLKIKLFRKEQMLLKLIHMGVVK